MCSKENIGQTELAFMVQMLKELMEHKSLPMEIANKVLENLSREYNQPPIFLW